MQRKFKIPTVNISATAFNLMGEADKKYKHAKLYVNSNPVKDSGKYYCQLPLPKGRGL